MITDAELEAMKDLIVANQPYESCLAIAHLIREVEELRAALRDVKEDWKQGAFLTRVTLAKVDAALGETT